MRRRPKVLLTTEGTYPFDLGGVSTWADILIKGLPEIDFYIFSVMMNPFVTQKFVLPSNVSLLIKVPLWGTEDPSEHLEDKPFSQIYLAKQKTQPRVIRQEFIPLFVDLLRHILREDGSYKEFGRVLFDLYHYFQSYDYLLSFKSPLAWKEFLRIIDEEVRRNALPEPTIFDAIQALGWVFRLMIVLNTPFPRSDIVHSAAAAFCSLPGVVAKQEYRSLFLLTEHGIYLREQYLSVARQPVNRFRKFFLLRLVSAISKLSYAFADVISPVCEYNTRWEVRLGAARKKIKVIYNGVDPAIFSPQPRVERPLTVLTIARIDPLKDIETLIRAAARVKQSLPGVRFLLFGSVSVQEYYERCLELCQQLGVQEEVVFVGHTDNPAAAYHAGDVVALPSISEAFPYTVIEAMMSGKAVVATDVGGTREALEGCGILTPPRDAEALSEAIRQLLTDARLREELGRIARERALDLFKISQAVDNYRQVYEKMLRKRPAALAKRQHQLTAVKRGVALIKLGQTQLGLEHLRLAVTTDPHSPAVPVLLIYIAKLYFQSGRYAEAYTEVKKAELLAELIRVPAA